MSRSNQLAGLITATPTATLDTINEINTSLNNDANLSTTLTNSIATKVSKSGDTFTGDVSFGDSIKAQFGAGSDLQIYHDGSNSIIKDTGTGDLIIGGDNNVTIANSALTEVKALFTTDGASSLYYDNSSKIQTTATGVNVAGSATLTGGALSLDLGNAVKWTDVAGSGVKNLKLTATHTYGTASDNDLQLDTRLNIVYSGAELSVMDNSGYSTANQGGGIRLRGNHTGTGANDWAYIKSEKANTTYNNASANLKFEVNSGSGLTERMRIDSSGNVVIGSNGADQSLTLHGTTSAPSTTLGDAIFDIRGSSSAHLLMGVTNASPWGAWIGTDSTAQPLILQGAGGNVGIGHTNPTQMLYIKQTVDDAYTPTNFNDKSLITLNVPNTEDNYAGIRFTHAGGTEGFFGYYRESSTSDRAEFVWQGYDGNANSYKEYMRLNWSGQLCIGRTSGGGNLNISGSPYIYNLGTGAGSHTLKYNSGTGQVTYDTSSERFKENIRDSIYGLNDVLQMRSTQFEYKDDGRSDVGFIAEELNLITPELVIKDLDGRPESVSYDRLVSVLTKAIQELSAKVTALENAS